MQPAGRETGLGKQLFPDGGRGEEATDTGGAARAIDHGYGFGTDVASRLQRVGKLSQSAELGGGGSVLVEVAHQANADAGGIDGRGVARRLSRFLRVPPLIDLNLPIDPAVTVADHKVVAGVNIGTGRGSVVDIDVLPAGCLA